MDIVAILHRVSAELLGQYGGLIPLAVCRL